MRYKLGEEGIVALVGGLDVQDSAAHGEVVLLLGCAHQVQQLTLHFELEDGIRLIVEDLMLYEIEAHVGHQRKQ